MASLQCHRCGYVWEYSGSLQRATCPSCSNKVPVDAGRLAAPPEELADDYDLTVEEVKELLRRAQNEEQ